MQEAVTVQEEKQELNKYLNEVLEGVPEDICATVLEAVAFFGEDATGDPSLEEEQVEKIRYAYTILTTHLIENKLGELNDGQKLFLNTGALADVVIFEDEDGDHFSVQLLEPSLYQRLREAVLNVGELPAWANMIYRTEDRFNAIALGVLEPSGLDKKSLAKFRNTRGESQKNLTLEQTSELTNSHQVLLNHGEEILDDINQNFNQYYGFVRQIPDIQKLLQKTTRYQELIANRNPTSADRDELRELSNDNGHILGSQISKYAEELLKVFQAIKDKGTELDVKHRELKEITARLVNAGIEDFGSVRDRDDILFDEETVRLIKTAVTSVSTFAVSAARNSAQRVPTSTSRVLLDSHTERLDHPLEQGYATLQNIVASIQKILKLHVNLFPLDGNGNPMIPPILIEPIRNYLEWSEDRFFISFVSGEMMRNGPRISFTPVDMAVLRACGFYAFKDKIFDYRGNRIQGNLMADYAGKIEAKTSVQWQGDDKKFKLVASSQEVDSANRDEAVQDYMDFLFSAVNDFPPPTGLSKRKIAVMLKYVLVENMEKTIALVLRYVADKEPEEAKATILHHADKDRLRAKKMIEDAYNMNPGLFTEGLDVYITKILGGAA